MPLTPEEFKGLCVAIDCMAGLTYEGDRFINAHNLKYLIETNCVVREPVVPPGMRLISEKEYQRLTAPPLPDPVESLHLEITRVRGLDEKPSHKKTAAELDPGFRLPRPRIEYCDKPDCYCQKAEARLPKGHP